MPAQPYPTAPEIHTSQWFNTSHPIRLESLRGKVVVLEAFQMLCPGCVSHGLPQAQMVSALFPAEKVAVIGLHTVFEHHAAMTPVSLQAFIHEYRITFPVGVDEAGPGDMPKTMAAYHMKGTPSLILIDQNGCLRANHFGQVHDIQLGAQIATLLAQDVKPMSHKPKSDDSGTGCNEDGCPVGEPT